MTMRQESYPVATSTPLSRFLVQHLDVTPGMNCLDVGCGAGSSLHEMLGLVSPGGVVVGVDVDQDVLVEAEAATWAASQIALCRADAMCLPFDGGTFDAVSASLLLLWVPEAIKVIQELVRVTGTGGRVAFVDLDLSAMRIEPALPIWETFAAALEAFQQNHGFDGEIGRRLYGFCHHAGLIDLRIQAQPALVVGGTLHAADAVHLTTGPLATAMVDEDYLSLAQLTQLQHELEMRMADSASLFVGGITYGVSGQVPEPA